VRRLDRYVLRDFLLYTLMGVALFVGIYILVDAFEKLDTLVDNHASLLLVVRYYLWSMPIILIQIAPIAVLLGSMLSLGQLRRFNEVTAMQGAGVSPVQIARPMLLAGLLLSVTVYGVSELLVPPAYRAQSHIMKVQIKGQPSGERTARTGIRYLGRGGNFYMIEFLDVITGSMRNVSIQTLRGDAIDSRIDAEGAKMADGLWRFDNGYLRTFADSSETSLHFRSYGTSRLDETPADFSREDRSPFQMNMADLRRYAERVRASGGRDRKMRVDYNLRVSFPLANLIMVLLGASLSLRIVRGGNVALGFGATLGVGFAYYACLRAGQALGYNGAISPLAAAWIGNLCFGALGAVFFWKVSR
jgi:lipopolysaccharide export system permease protein